MTLFLCLLVYLVGVQSQKMKPMIPTYPATLNLTRTNLCPQMNGLINGTVTAANVLRGATIRVAITYTTPSFNLLVSNLTGQPYGGYYYNIQQQLAARAGVNLQYVIVPPYPGPPMSYNTWMTKILKYVDMLGDSAYSDTVDRRASGFGNNHVSLLFYTLQRIFTHLLPSPTHPFPFHALSTHLPSSLLVLLSPISSPFHVGFTRGVIDQSLVMATSSLHTNNKVDFFSFLTPFR